MEELSKESQIMDAAINHAKKGDLEFFKDAPPDILMKARDSNGDTVLSIVVNGNHVDCCKEICQKCSSLLCSFDSNGYTPLHVAAFYGYLDILKILISTCDKADLENKHDIEDQGGDRADQRKASLTLRTTTSSGYNAMHSAAQGGKLESIKLLIEADPNNDLLRAGDKWNNTPLHHAVGTNLLEIVRLLIEADPDFLYGSNSDGKTPLLLAIDKAELQNGMLKLILELQPTQSKLSVNENGWTALHYCVSKKNLYAMGDIIQSFPESSKVADNEGQNFFQFAVKLGNDEMARHIIWTMKEITVEVLNSTDNMGRTPFEVASESQNESMINCLYGDSRVNKKLTVTKNLNWVVEKHNIEMMKLFMKENDDFLENIEEWVFLNSKNEEDETILFKATKNQEYLLCAKLCERCPSLIYHQSKGGHTALHHAAATGWQHRIHLDTILPVLIKAGADGRLLSKCYRNYSLKIVDGQGNTALHKAVLNHNLEAVKLLVEADPDCNYGANNSGDTPIMISIREAWSNENKFYSGEIRRLLIKMQPGQTMAWRWENGRTLLHDAASKGDLSCIEDFITFCPGILDVDDNERKNFLHIAAELGKVEVVRRVLRAKDIPSNVLYNQDKYGNTPMHVAAVTGNMSLMECFLSDLRFSKIIPRGEENIWALPHHAASDGDLGIIKDIIKWRSNLDVVDNESKNFLHIAAEFEKVQVVKQVLRVKDIPLDVLNHKDKDGNTPFHIAALTGNEILTRCFLFDRRVNKDTVNEDKQHVLRAIQFPYDKRKAGVLGIVGTADTEYFIKDRSAFVLVVGALIATVSFAAGITVPGGYNSDGPDVGTALFSKEGPFAAFIISNTLALIFSLYTIFSNFCATYMSKEADIIYQLSVANIFTIAAIYCMMAAFIAGSFAVLANSNWLAVVVCIISCLFFIFACHPICKIVKQLKRPT